MTTRSAREKKAAKRERRRERLEERSHNYAREQRRRLLWLVTVGALGIVVAAVVGFGGYTFVLNPSRPGESVSTYGYNDHSGPPSEGYSTNPPTSGPHFSGWPSWGIHDEPISLPFQVHALEHGGVLVQYNCPQGCPQEVNFLSSVTQGYSSQVILAPYQDMDSLIALTAWGKIELLDSFDLERIENFVKKNRGHGPEPDPS